jgi:hypothetical protein
MSTLPPHPTKAPIPRYHSKTAYHFPPEESTAILRVSAYHRKDFDLAVIWFAPRAYTHFVISTVIASRKPTATIGELDRLPLELINEICLWLDIASLFRFRQVNARARQILNALHEYRVITKHALNPLCALLRTQTAPGVTLLDFYQLLCMKACSLCGNAYGDLVYLPTWIRCCSSCLRGNALETRVTTLASVKQILKLSKSSLNNFQKLKTLPGIYSMEERRRTSRLTVISTLSALSAYSKENTGIEPTQEMISKLNSLPILAFMACCAIPSYNPQTGQVEIGVSCAGCQVAVEDSIITHTGAWACEMRDKVYSRIEFLKHIEWCEQAQLLWLGSNRGTIESPKWPYSCKKGGFFKHRG